MVQGGGITFRAAPFFAEPGVGHPFSGGE